ncbi:alcohol dehydrogenase [Aspergillus lucknowensis]|uniref:Alcohol dehydrogenase n=1 Tax=Aspergillus lucknowensis TaxID=176173 RepID=A0ABR4LRU4_9EURO
MRALVYLGSGAITVEDRPKPTIQSPTDAIVRVTHTGVCGTDLHIIQGRVPSCSAGRILGHEGVGIIDALGPGVANLRIGDRVLIGSISACGKCPACRQGMNSHCASGGWLLGNTIDGVQADFVRIPHADFSLHLLHSEIPSPAAVALSDAFPTAYEGGIQNGQVHPGAAVAIVGTGPVGLSALMLTRALYPSAFVVVIGRGESRLRIAKSFGAQHIFSTLNGISSTIEAAKAINKGRGFDVVVEAVGTRQSFDLAQQLTGVGGTIATLSYFNSKCDLHLDTLWNKNICLRTRLTDGGSIPELLRLTESSTIDPGALVSHVFSFSDIMKGYETFQAASAQDALKVVIYL